MAKIRTVPKVYIESEEIKIGNLQKALDAVKIYAEKANSQFLRFNKGKENEKIKHRRVQQENKRTSQT